jgi:hypothetical protein
MRARVTITPDMVDRARAIRDAIEHEHAIGTSREQYGADRRDPADKTRRMLRATLAEMVVGQALGLAVSPPIVGTMKWRVQPDLATGVEVRHTELRRPRLLLHRDDPPDAPHVLVTGDELEMTLHGWATPREFLVPLWWDATLPHPTWAVPIPALHLLPVPPADGRPVAMRHRVAA